MILHNKWQVNDIDNVVGQNGGKMQQPAFWSTKSYQVFMTRNCWLSFKIQLKENWLKNKGIVVLWNDKFSMSKSLIFAFDSLYQQS